jgi:hypothetical protein
VSSHDSRIVVDIKNVHLHAEANALVGCSMDEQTSYVLKLSRDEFAELLDSVAPLAEGRCPRCDFEEALSVLCYAGEFIRTHFGPAAPGQLSESEVALLESAQAWAADDAIVRCLDGDAQREH